MENEHQLMLQCTCYEIKHILRMSYFRDQADMIFIDTLLSTTSSFWRRLKIAFLYLFCKNFRESADCICIDTEQARDTLSFIRQYLEDSKKIMKHI